MQFRKLKALGDKAVAQVTDQKFFTAIDSQNNSIALIMKHLAGNMRSRWTEFLTSDGEKPDRRRDREFVIDEADTKNTLTEQWDAGWQCVFDAVEPLTTGDLEKTILIRGEQHSVIEAINRQLTHYAYHDGQIVFLAKHFRTGGWQPLSIPRGKSGEFNKKMDVGRSR